MENLAIYPYWNSDFGKCWAVKEYRGGIWHVFMVFRTLEECRDWFKRTGRLKSQA